MLALNSSIRYYRGSWVSHKLPRPAPVDEKRSSFFPEGSSIKWSLNWGSLNCYLSGRLLFAGSLGRKRDPVCRLTIEAQILRLPVATSKSEKYESAWQYTTFLIICLVKTRLTIRIDNKYIFFKRFKKNKNKKKQTHHLFATFQMP